MVTSYKPSSLNGNNTNKTSNKARKMNNNQLDDCKMIVIPSTKSSPPRKSKLRLRNQSNIMGGLGGQGNNAQGANGIQHTEEFATDAIIDKKSICEEILLMGCVQSYVDFFYLTHRPDPNFSPTDENEEREIDIPLGEMAFIRDNLVQAEIARRQGDTELVYSAYDNLARYFQDIDDSKTGVYFYEKCLEIAKLTSNTHQEMASNHKLGVVYQKIGDIMSAMDYHEQHHSIASNIVNREEMKRASAQLVIVYKRYAESLEEKGKQVECVEYYDKCLTSAREATDKKSEGIASYRLGRTFVYLDKAEEAIAYLLSFQKICSDLGDVEGLGLAFSALAAGYQKLGDDDQAVKCLEQFLKTAAQTDDLMAQGDASCNLGVIYSKRRQYHLAVQFFQKNFDIARQIVAGGQGDVSLIAKSQVYLGIAKSNAMIGPYMQVLNFDLYSLLDWKSSRSELKIKKQGSI